MRFFGYSDVLFNFNRVSRTLAHLNNLGSSYVGRMSETKSDSHFFTREPVFLWNSVYIPLIPAAVPFFIFTSILYLLPRLWTAWRKKSRIWWSIGFQRFQLPVYYIGQGHTLSLTDLLCAVMSDVLLYLLCLIKKFKSFLLECLQSILETVSVHFFFLVSSKLSMRLCQNYSYSKLFEANAFFRSTGHMDTAKQAIQSSFQPFDHQKYFQN